MKDDQAAKNEALNDTRNGQLMNLRSNPTMKKIALLIALYILGTGIGHTQSLDIYVREGLSDNEALKQRNFALAKSYQALKEAKGLFYPTLAFQSDYNFAQGGRKINLPLGYLFNNAYATLNQLTGSGKFPQINNQAITLTPNNYSDTRLLTTMPLVNAELQYNYKSKKEAITQQQAEINVYKRSLVRSIKEAYYNLLLTMKQTGTYQNAHILLQENLKLTRNLVANGKSLKGNLLRVQSEINTNQAKLTEAENNIAVAKAYLNFLLNKPPDEPIVADSAQFVNADFIVPSISVDQVLERREELQSLKSGIRQAEYAVKEKKAFHIPTLSTFVNAGYQGTAFHFGSDQRYINGGVSLKWSLFNGNQSGSKVKQAQLDVQILTSQLNDLERQFNVQLITAYKSVNTAQEQVKGALVNQQQAKEFYRETKNRYQQGLILLVELTDASTQYINSQLAYQIAATNLLTRLADVEQVTASYPL
jgi:outer membrane protein